MNGFPRIRLRAGFLLFVRLRLAQQRDVDQVEQAAHGADGKQKVVRAAKGFDAKNAVQKGRRERAGQLRHGDDHALRFAAFPAGQHGDEEQRHREVLQNGGVGKPRSDAELHDERSVQHERNHDYQQAPRDEPAFTRIGGKMPAAEFEPGVKHGNIEH